jgi:hypothetical protein
LWITTVILLIILTSIKSWHKGYALIQGNILKFRKVCHGTVSNVFNVPVSNVSLFCFVLCYFQSQVWKLKHYFIDFFLPSRTITFFLYVLYHIFLSGKISMDFDAHQSYQYSLTKITLHLMHSALNSNPALPQSYK